MSIEKVSDTCYVAIDVAAVAAESGAWIIIQRGAEGENSTVINIFDEEDEALDWLVAYDRSFS